MKFLDQIETEIILFDFFNKWSHFALTLSQFKEKVEISLYQNGLFLQTLIFHIKKNDINSNLSNESLEFCLGFDVPLKKKSLSIIDKIKEENIEYFRIGPFLLLDEVLSSNEINLLYSITDSKNGTINLLRKEHSLNFDRISIENLRNLGFSLIDFCGNHDFRFSRLLIKTDLAFLVNSICIENDPKFMILLETKDYERTKKSLVLANKAEKNENCFGILSNETPNSNFLYESFNSMRNESLKLDFLIDVMLDSLEKTENQETFLKILKLLIKFCEVFQEEIQKEKICVIYELLIKKKELFNVSFIEEIFLLFSKKIPGERDSKDILISNLRNFEVFFKNSEFYRTFFRNSMEIVNFFELFCRIFFNSKCNVFSE